jgi:hypothetical protein
MRPARDIERLIRNTPINTNAERDKKVLDDVMNALEKPKKAKSAAMQPNIWRTIMKSPITKLSSAAGIIIAAMVGIMHVAPSVDGTSVLLADVVRNIERANSATWRVERVFTSGGSEIPCLNSDAVWYYSSRYGAREDIYDKEGRLLHQGYWLPREDVRIRVLPPMMQYERTELTDAERMAWGQPDIQAIVDLIESAQPTPLGRKEIDGRVAEGFQFTNPHSDVCFTILNSAIAAVSPISFESGIARFWIDLESGLPVRYEAELLTHDKLVTSLSGGKPVQITVTGHQTQWDVEIEPSVFKPDIHPDYEQTEWWPAGCYPAHDIPDQDMRDVGGNEEWLRQNPGDYGFFYTTRLGHCIKLYNQFLADIAVFRFRGESEDLRDLHAKLGTWFVSTPTGTKVYYAKLGPEKAEQLFEFSESTDALTLLARPEVKVKNGQKYLIGIDDLGLAVLCPVQKYREQIVDLSCSFFLDGPESVDVTSARKAGVDIPSVKVGPDEAVLVKFADTETPTGEDATYDRVFILMRMAAR